MGSFCTLSLAIGSLAMASGGEAEQSLRLAAGLDVFDLVLEAGWIVQRVMVTLAVLSVFSWAIIVFKWRELRAAEQFILTVCTNGYGKLSSAYEYRRTGRGGQGITNIDNIARNGDVVASFPATKGHQLMLVTDQAKLIRMSLASLRVIGRGSAGLRLFNVAADEHVVSAARIEETEDEAEANLADETPVIDAQDDATVGDDLSQGPEDGE